MFDTITGHFKGYFKFKQLFSVPFACRFCNKMIMNLNASLF